MSIKHQLSAILLAFATTGYIGQANAAAGERVLRFASYATERPTEELHKLEPFQEQIEASLKRQGIRAKVEVRIYPTYENGITAITSGQADFSRLGPVSYVNAKARNPAIQILAVEAFEGKKQFEGVVIVRKDSPIQSVADLKGKRIAFGEPGSTTGRYIPQAAMAKAGLHAKDLAGYEYLGRHDKVAFAVASGSHDAGTTNMKTYKKYAESKGLRDIARFPAPTQAWVARPNLPPQLFQALRQALLELQGPGLEYIDRNGFIPGDDHDYDELRRTMKAAQDFDN